MIKKLYWGICVFAGCTAENIQDVVRRIAAFSGSSLKLTTEMSEMLCYRNESETVTTGYYLHVSYASFNLSTY